jgi:hypothetical protein
VRHAASTPAGHRRRRDKARGARLAGRGPAGPPGASARQSGGHADDRRTLTRSQRLADLLPYLLVICGTAVSLLVMRAGQHDVRGGTLVLAGVLQAAAVARLALPDHRAGLLASRRRLVDVAAFAALGIGLLVAALFFPVPV